MTAYLNAEMDEEVYIKLLSICGDDEALVRQLWKALYGHPKAGQLWNKVRVKFLTQRVFTQSVQDKCFFFNLELFIFLILYVDDVGGCCTT